MFGHSYFGARYYGPRYWGDGGDGIPPVVLDETMYWGLLRKKKKQDEDEDSLNLAEVSRETEELVAAQAESAMQAALQKAMLKKQSKRELDGFIQGISKKAKDTRKAQIDAEDEQIAQILGFLL